MLNTLSNFRQLRLQSPRRSIEPYSCRPRVIWALSEWSRSHSWNRSQVARSMSAAGLTCSPRFASSSPWSTEYLLLSVPEEGATMNSAAPSEHVLEIVTPRTNAARLSPAEHFFAAVAQHVGTLGQQSGFCRDQRGCRLPSLSGAHRNSKRAAPRGWPDRRGLSASRTPSL